MARVGELVGRYEVVRELGRGGMAIVYLARHADLGRLVALKELFALGATDPVLVERFCREAHVAAALAHPNIVAVHDFVEHEGVPYIAMEYVGGGTLRPRMPALTLAQIAGVLEGVLAGLAHAERRGVVHRDLKPENLMVTDEGLVKIGDFGIAKAIAQTAQLGPSLTATGMTMGTPTYMAPEQAMGGVIGPWTDLYSLGVVTYEMCVGGPPFSDPETPVAVLLHHVSDPVPDPRLQRPDLDDALTDWILNLLSKQPADRPSGAAVAWEALEPLLVRLLGPLWRRDAPLAPLAAAPAAAAPTPAPPVAAAPAAYASASPPAGAEGEWVTYRPAVPATPVAAPAPSFAPAAFAVATPPPAAPSPPPPALSPSQLAGATPREADGRARQEPTPPPAEPVPPMAAQAGVATPASEMATRAPSAPPPGGVPPATAPPAGGHRRRWAVVGVAIVLAGAIAFVAVALSGGKKSPPPPAVSTATATATATEGPAPATTYAGLLKTLPRGVTSCEKDATSQSAELVEATCYDTPGYDGWVTYGLYETASAAHAAAADAPQSDHEQCSAAAKEVVSGYSGGFAACDIGKISGDRHVFIYWSNDAQRQTGEIVGNPPQSDSVVANAWRRIYVP